MTDVAPKSTSRTVAVGRLSREASIAPPPPVASTASVARRSSNGGAWTILLAFSIALAVDWWRPLSALSWIVAVVVSALALPWAVLVLRTNRPEAGAPVPADPGSRTRTLIFHLSLIFLLGCFLVAKWLVLLRAEGRPEFAGSSHNYSLAILIVVALGLFANSFRAARLLAMVSDHPARLMALTFGMTGFLGAALLSLPVSVESVSSVSLIDNLFMAFSAVCVTGLSVNNVAETYSLFGQIVLCALIQVGGLGIMVLSAAFAVIAGQRLRVKSSAVIAQMVDATSLASIRRTVLMILIYTFLIESAGVAVLYSQLDAYPELAQRAGSDMAGPGSLLWAAIFHTVSAFCNAGLSNVQGGLVPFVGDAGVVLTISALVILGSLGFPVIDELLRAAFTKLRRRRVPVLSLNTRVALRVTGMLLVAMTLIYLVLEWRSSMKDLGVVERLTSSILQSASSRSAGFNVVDIGAMQPAVLVLTCAAMFIGGSPGSTTGGVKTTTLAVLFAGMRAELQGTAPQLLDRRLPDTVVRKAIGVAFSSLVIVLVAFTLLLLIESHPPLELAFETVASFSTAGMSTGITPKLSPAGKLLITALMFVGRIGPLTLALAFSLATKARALELPQERVMIG